MARLFWRPRRGWWHEPAGVALALICVFLAIPVIIGASQVVHGVWALIVEATSLAVILVTAIGFWFIKRHTWMLAAPLGFAGAFSLAFALVEDWNAQVRMVLNVAGPAIAIVSLGFFLAGLVALLRMHRRFNRLLRAGVSEVRERLQSEGLFREDGERIVVYVNRGALLRRLAIQAAAVAVLAALVIWLHEINTDDPRPALAALVFGIVVVYGSIVIVLSIVRMAARTPTLIINADGIVDNGSLLVTGRGLLRWNEILGVREYSIDLSKVPWRLRMAYRKMIGSLEIDLADYPAVRVRQPLWKHALATFASGGKQPLGLRILPSLLDRPAAELVAQVNEYIKRHAPPDSWHSRRYEDDEDADESDGADDTDADAPGPTSPR